MTGFPRISQPAPAPTILTERLRLRPMELADWSAYRDAMTGPHSVHMGGPFLLNAAWGFFCADLAGWTLTGGGALTVETLDGVTVGQVVLNDIPAFPELELGWMIYPGQEGNGYAKEAASALLDWTLSHLRPVSLVSYVSPENGASRAVALKLGGREDPEAERPSDGDIVYRHAPADGTSAGLPHEFSHAAGAA